MGLMLLFGTLTLAPRMIINFRKGNTARALYFAALSAVSLVFAAAAFYFAFT